MPNQQGQRDRSSATSAALAQARTADSGERTLLEHEVVRLNLKVAKDVAHRYVGRGIATDDLEQVACLALVKAARRFDADKGEDFLSYAVPTIRGELQRHFRDSGWMVRPPRSLQEMQSRVTAAEPLLAQRLGRPPTPAEIAEHLGVEADRVTEALSASGCFAPSSLDDPEHASHTTRLSSDERGYAAAEARVTVGGLLNGLSVRDRRLLQMRYVLGCTQAEIGDEIGVTQTQVSRQLSSLLDRLRLRAGVA